jgi:hypothetical protein
MAFTLADADLLSPKTVRNEIVRDIDNMSRMGELAATDVFPLVALSDSEEKFYKMDGIRTGMQAAGLTSESPVGNIEKLTEDNITVSTYKQKISPEKGVDTELNTQQEILRLFEAAADFLREDLMLTREKVTWQGDTEIDGMIGPDGQTPHPDLNSSHVLTPTTAYSDLANSAPQDDFIEADYLVTDDGTALQEAGMLTAYVSPSVMYDLKRNDDLESRFSGVEVQGLTEQQVGNVLPFDRIQPVRTKLVRTNENGEPIDDTDTVVDDPTNAATDNVLEPYDASAGTKRRNIVIGAPGEVSAFIPFFVDRLSEMADNAPPSGDMSVDETRGFMTQTWTTNDPAVSWLKIAQEVGFHLMRPDNWVVIQDI